MLYKILYAAASLLLLNSCKEEAANKSNVKDEKTKAPALRPVETHFRDEIKIFDLHLTDSVVFIFSEHRAFDTAFVLILRKLGDTIKGNYFYYPPALLSGFYLC